MGYSALFATDDHLHPALDENRRTRILLSRRVSSYYEFADVILDLKNTSAVRQTMDSTGIIASACYLLGWFLGDLGKHYRNELC